MTLFKSARQKKIKKEADEEEIYALFVNATLDTFFYFINAVLIMCNHDNRDLNNF